MGEEKRQFGEERKNRAQRRGDAERKKEWKAMRRSSRSVVRLEAQFTESEETAPKGAAVRPRNGAGGGLLSLQALLGHQAPRNSL